MFGPHLIVDGSVCNTEKLADRVFIEQVLHDFRDVIGMTRIGGPYIFDYQAPDPAYSGVSGFVIIAESHIAIHTFPELDYFTMDVFSCRNFDPERAVEFVTGAFEAKQMDRTVLLRGLSFHGPHHGKFTLPTSFSSASEGDTSSSNGQAASAPTGKDGAQLNWPTYGITPDYGSDSIRGVPGSRGQETFPLPSGEEMSTSSAEEPRDPQEVAPVLINPTASISGLLQSLAHAGGQGRALGQVVSLWEHMVRDSQMCIVLALSQSLIASGMREVLVYAIEHRYIHAVVLSADDLLADLYESLGFVYTQSHLEGGDIVSSPQSTQAALRTFTAFAHEVEPEKHTNTSTLWRQLGTYLAKHAPRKGVLQAAVATGLPLFTPDLASSTLGEALLALHERGLQIHFPTDLSLEVNGLNDVISSSAHLGIVRVGAGIGGTGSVEAVIRQTLARSQASVAGHGDHSQSTPQLCASISIGTSRPFSPGSPGERHLALPLESDLVLPLAITALSQRIPRRRNADTFQISRNSHRSQAADSVAPSRPGTTSKS